MNVLKFIFSLNSKEEKIPFICWFLFPLFFSSIIYGIALLFPPEDFLTIYSLIISYILSWLITLFLLTIYLYFFYEHIKKVNKFDDCKNEFGKTINFLMKNRVFGNLSYVDFITSSIFLLYILELFLIIFLIKNDYTSAYIFLFSAIFLSIFVNKIRNITVGIQEGFFKSYSLMFFLSFSFLSFFAIISLNGIDIENWDFSVLIYMLSPFLVPIITAIVEWALLKNRPKHKSEKVGWSRLLNLPTIVSEGLLSFFTAYLIFLLIASSSVLAIGLLSGSILIIGITLISIAACIILTVILPWAFFRDFASYFVKSVIDWNRFIDRYNNQPIDCLSKESTNLVKIIGKCKALSINEKYRKKIHGFNQHYLLEIEKSKEKIDVISLEEKNPLIFTKKNIREGDEIKIIGKIKSSLNDETFSSEERVSKYLLAYHTEPKFSESLPHNTLDDWFFSLILNELKKVKKQVSDSKEISELIEKTLIKSLPECADILLKELKLKSNSMLKNRRKYKKGFEKRLFKRWKQPINLLEMFINISLEAGAEFNSENREKAVENKDFVFEALSKMHARGCQISFEILELIKSGFADGAMARWRSLHEISVLSFFIKDNGQKTAKRFLHYELIETYKEAIKYREYCKELGLEPLSDDEFKKIKNQVDELCQQFKSDYKKQYGWASEIIKNKNIYFTDLEKKVNLEKFRPYYQMACNCIHAGPKGASFKLGLLSGSPKSQVLLAGPSNYGLADPGQLSAISLHQITTCYLTTNPTVEHLITIATMQKLIDELCEAFVKVQSQIEEDEKINFSRL